MKKLHQQNKLRTKYAKYLFRIGVAKHTSAKRVGAYCKTLEKISSEYYTSNDFLKESTAVVYKEIKHNDTIRDERGKEDTECTHQYWIKKCSFCKGIMESDRQVNYEIGKPTKELYTYFDNIVCSYVLATKLQELKVIQKSRFYWVHMLDTNIVSLRSSENVTLRGTRVAAAFTSSELCRHFNRLPESIMTSDIYEYIGRNAHDPTRLARLYIKLLTNNNIDICKD